MSLMGSTAKGAASIKPKLTKEQKAETEYFIMNALLVSSLLPFIPLDERETVHKWLRKLYSLGTTPRERSIRNDYIWFLLVQLENGIVTLPFIKDPPDDRLPPLSDAVEKNIYEEILEAANNRSSYLAEDFEQPPPRNESPTETTQQNIEHQRIRPSEFLESQPKPKFGFIAYGSCFSDQFN